MTYSFLNADPSLGSISETREGTMKEGSLGHGGAEKRENPRQTSYVCKCHNENILLKKQRALEGETDVNAKRR